MVVFGWFCCVFVLCETLLRCVFSRTPFFERMSDAFFSFSLHAVDPVAAAPFFFADSISDSSRDLLSSCCLFSLFFFHKQHSFNFTLLFAVPSVSETCPVPQKVREAEAAQLASRRLQEYTFVALADSLQLED